MRYLTGFVLCMIMLQIQVNRSFAVTGSEVKTAVESRYRITVPGFFGNFKEIGSVLIVRKEGLRVDRPRAFFRPNIIANGQTVTPGGGDVPLGSDIDSNLRIGDRLYLYKIETGEDYVDLVLFTVKELMVTGSGTKGPIQLQATTRFRYDGGLTAVSADRVLADIGAWFAVEGVTTGGNGYDVKPPANETPKVTDKEQTKPDDIMTKTVKLGQTPEEVTAIMGTPDRKALLGQKIIYIYGKMKLIFIDGKLADAD